MDLNGAALERQTVQCRHAKCASEDDENGARQAGFPLGVSGRMNRDRERTDECRRLRGISKSDPRVVTSRKQRRLSDAPRPCQ